MKDTLKIVGFSVNGIIGENERRMSEAPLLGQGMTGSDSGDECGVWEGLKGGAV